MVEKIRRDVRITTIFEGTSEIMEMTIARDRWQQHLKSRGRLLPGAGCGQLEALHAANPDVGRRDVAALGCPRAGGDPGAVPGRRLTRNQHVLLPTGAS